jgi:hypothetical protein
VEEGRRWTEPSPLCCCRRLFLPFYVPKHVVERFGCQFDVFRFMPIACFPTNPIIQASGVACEFLDGRQLIVELNLSCSGLLEECKECLPSRLLRSDHELFLAPASSTT